MKKNYLLLVLALWVLTANAQRPFPTKNAQGKLEERNSKGAFSGQMKLFNATGKKIPNVVCPLEKGDAHTYIAPPAGYLEMMEKKARETGAKSTFLVNYHNFPANAQQSFQRAVDIWSSLISSSVPIRIEAYYTTLGDNILGNAHAADFSNNFDGVQKAFTWYPMAMAEKIATKDLNSIQDPDIIANFNISNVNLKWYFSEGTEKVAPAGTYDFTSVVLHEMGHGLGFVSSFDGSPTDGTANWGYGTGLPFIFDQYVVNNNGQKLIDTTNFKNNSAALKTQLTSSNLFLNNPTALAANVSPKLYAPRTWNSGSSISHLDDITYPAGTANSLMTSAAKPTEINMNPGPIVLNFFGDMGWKSTSLIHDSQRSIETRPTTVILKATITSDTTIMADSMKVYYSSNNDQSLSKSVSLVRNGTTNNYTATIPIAAKDSSIIYYMTVKDAFGITSTNPPQAPRYYWQFDIGIADVTPPVLEFYPVNIARSTDKIDLLADVEDDYAAGVDSVYIQYSVNGAAAKKFILNKLDITLYPQYSRGKRDPYTYLATNAFSGLKNGDKVQYRIIAIDKAKNRNTATLPDNGTYFDLVIADPKTTAVTQYSNDFENASTTSDFAGVGFKIGTSSDFTNAIQSDHPYTNGTGYGKQTYRVMELLQPITVSSSTPTLTFDEVVLVEPNDNGGTYAGGEQSGFYDYVVVQGSNDGGNTWVDFLDGYNSTDQSTWLSAWNKNLVLDAVNTALVGFKVYDSGTTGTKSLLHNKSVDMTATGDFKAGDKVLIRFVLFSDELTHGWGWTIDNLKIQVPPAPVVTAVSKPISDVTLSISPNPSPDILQIRATLKQAGKVQMEVVSESGTKLMQQSYTADSQNFSQTIDLRGFSTGTYFVRIYSNDTVLMKKFIVAK